MSTAGPNSCGTGSNYNDGGDNAWSSPTNIQSDDSSYASVALGGAAYSQALYAKNFGFSIPTGATITSIKFTVKRKASMRDCITEYHIIMCDASGSPSGSDKADTSTKWSDANETIEKPSGATPGDSTYWGLTLTPELVNDADFGLKISARNTNMLNQQTAYIQYVSCTVTYTVPATLTANSGSFEITGTSCSLLKSSIIVPDAGEFSLSGDAADLLNSRLLSCGLGEYSLSAAGAGLVRSRIISVASADYSLAGNPISLLASRRLGCVSGEFSLLAADAVGLLKSSILSAGIGEYLLSGTDVMFELTASGAYILAAYSGAFEIAGTNADLLKSSLLSADAGDYSISASISNLYATRIIYAGAGSYNIAGTNASLLRSIRLAALVGTFSTASSSASLLKNSVLIPSAGAFETAGTNADLLKSYILSCESGSYIIDGSALSLLKGFKIDAETGEFTISGQPVNLLASRIVTTQNGTFVIIGNNAVLRMRTAFDPIWARRSNNLSVFGGYYGKL